MTPEEIIKKYGQLQSIQGVEIFAAGTWNGDNYTDEDLDRIVHAFNETKGITKPYLKLGHSNKQALLAKDELPAAGFVEKIYRVGKKIVADFVNIPEKIYELIKRKAYSKVSSEIFVNFKTDGKTYPFALKAVALLGGETPAVHSLNEILALYSLGEVAGVTTSDAIKAYEFEPSFVNPTSEELAMTLEEALRQNEKLQSQVTSLQSENAELETENKQFKEDITKTQNEVKEFKAKADEANAKILKIEKETREKEIDAEVKQYVKDGKIVAAQAPFLTELLKNVKPNEETKEFTIKDKKFADVKSLVKAFIDAHVDIEVTEEGQSEMGDLNRSSEDAFVQKVRKYAKDNKVTFKEAMLELSESNQPEADKE